MNKRIEDLEDGFRGTITVLLLQVNKGVTAKGAPYLSLQFQDKTGRMDAKYWNVNEALLHAFAPGMIVNVQGDVLCHQKQLQFRVNKMEVVDKNEIDINEFVKSGSISKEELKQRLYERISEIKNQTIYKIVLEVVNDYEKISLIILLQRKTIMIFGRIGYTCSWNAGFSRSFMQAVSVVK